MDINMVRRYSNLGEMLLCITYNALSVKLTGILRVFNGCAQYKAKARAVSKKTCMKASQPGERTFLDRTGPFLDIFIGNMYWISVVDNYRHYY